MALSDSETSAAADARKGWIIVGALFLMLAVVVAGRSSIGLMIPFWIDDMGWSTGFISTAGAIMMVVMAVCAPAAGLVIDRYGAPAVYGFGMTLMGIAYILCSFMTEPWHLILLFSVFGGIGAAVISPSLVSTTVAQYFDDRVGLATSLATSGSTGGQLALMPVLGLLVVSFTWRPSFIAVGVFILFTMVVVLLLIRDRAPTPKAGATRPDGWALKQTLGILGRNPTFWLIASGFFICGFTTIGAVKIHLINYAEICGFPPLEGAFAYGVLSFFSLAGMIVYGYLSDRLNRPMLLASIYFFRALTFLLLLNIADSPAILYSFVVLFGIFDYATAPIVASLVASHVGRHIMGVSMGFIFASHSLGGALGSFMGGWLYELFASYDWVWIVALALVLIACIITLFIREDRTPVQATPEPVSA